MAKRDFIESSGNVFADLAIKIADILRRRRLTQVQAAAILGVDQPKVSALIRGRLAGFSIERLLRFLLLLGADVSITIKPRQRSRTRPRAGNSGRHLRLLPTGVLTVVDLVAGKASKSQRLNNA